MFKETRKFFKNLFARKVWYLTVTTITKDGHISQVHFGPAKEESVDILSNAFHRIAEASSNHTIHTITHKVETR